MGGGAAADETGRLDIVKIVRLRTTLEHTTADRSGSLVRTAPDDMQRQAVQGGLLRHMLLLPQLVLLPLLFVAAAAFAATAATAFSAAAHSSAMVARQVFGAHKFSNTDSIAGRIQKLL